MCFSAPASRAAVTVTGYLLATTVSPLLSSQRAVNLVGMLVLISFAPAYLIYATWFISVWCLVAAFLSVVVALRFFGQGKSPELAK